MLDLAGAQLALGACGEQHARAAHKALHPLASAQHPDQSPNAVIVHRRALPRPPDEADHREALARVAMEQILLVAIGMRPGIGLGQPVVAGD